MLTHSELGMFHEYRRQGKERSKQRAVNFDWNVVDRVFPAAKDTDTIEMTLKFDTDQGVRQSRQWLKRQEKNWRLEGNCPKDKCYHFVEPGCLFAMEVDAGTSPASGSWAVFAPNHPVSTAILSKGESSRLTNSSMIALHDEEGLQSWEVLSVARPDLFSAPRRTASVSENRATFGPDGVALPPNPVRLVEILASVGHTLPSAVADLVDNAISADATEVSITFGRPDGGHGRWMSIADNGRGMDRGALAEAMRIGSNSDYEGNSLGKYGYGLKGASWSQAKTFTVVSKADGHPLCHLTWDIGDMDGWVAKSNRLEQWEVNATTLGRHGTVVLWKEMRPPEAFPMTRGLDPYSDEIMRLERHLALVFHRFLEGTAKGRKRVSISINGNPVGPNNPFGHPLATANDVKSIRVPTEHEDGRVLVQPFLLPSEEEIEDYHRPEGPDGIRRAKDLIGLHGKRNETQGLFIYRHDRLIKWGGWHQMWETSDEKTKLARVMVSFDKVLDEAFRINISKQIVELPQQLQAEIKKLAQPVRKESQKKFRKMSAKGPPSSAPGNATGAPFNSRAKVAPSPDPETSSKSDDHGEKPHATSPRVAIKEVRTEKFVWKVTTGITGSLDLQVSEVNPNLAALVRQICRDPQGLSHLASFLVDLDDVDIQKHILAKKAT